MPEARGWAARQSVGGIEGAAEGARRKRVALIIDLWTVGVSQLCLVDFSEAFEGHAVENFSRRFFSDMIS
jgi:hypothetical protein